MKKICSFALLFTTLLFLSCGSDKGKETTVLIETYYGNIKVKLYNETPLHRDNFLKLINDSTSNGFTFHRIVKDFMIQGGKIQTDSIRQTIAAEIQNVYPTYYHKRGALGAARWDNDTNPRKESDAMQFYIITGERFSDYGLNELEEVGQTFNDEQKKTYKTKGGAPSLDGKYTVFGEVTEGMDVVDKIQHAKVVNKEHPTQLIKMRMTIIKE